MTRFRTFVPLPLRSLAIVAALAIASACQDVQVPTASPPAGSPRHLATPVDAVQEPADGGIEAAASTSCGAPSRITLEDYGWDGVMTSGAQKSLRARLFDASNCELFPGWGFTWSTANASIAFFPSPRDLPGTEVQGKFAGQTYVAVKYGDLSVSYRVTVQPGSPARVVVSPTSYTLAFNQAHTFTATVFDAVGNRLTTGVDWTSNNPGVSASGGWVLVSDSPAMTPNPVTITATARNSRVAGTASVQIVFPECYCPPGVRCNCLLPTSGVTQ